jgi:hypothetical protein
MTVNLIDSLLTSTDNTAYPIQLTNNTRTHEIHPPAGLDPITYPINTVTTAINTYSPITTKTWTGKITNILELTYPAANSFSEHIVDITVTGNSEKNIVDDVNRCNLQCNMRALTSRYNKALQSNPANAVNIANEQLTPALINAFMYTSNIECGNFDLAEAYYQEVLKFTGSSPDCECSDSEVPTLILASGGGGGNSNTYVVDVCGTNSALSVTSNTIGDETTYAICFDDTIWTKINTLTETDVISSDGSVNISTSIVGYNKEYDITVVPSTPVDSFSGIIDITMDAAPTNPPLSEDFRTSWSTVVGTKLQEPTIVNVNAGSWSTTNNLFYLEGYIAASGGEFPKPQLQVTGQSPTDSFNTKHIAVKITFIDTVNDRIYFTFIDVNALSFSGGTLSSLVGSTIPLSVSVIINA